MEDATVSRGRDRGISVIDDLAVVVESLGFLRVEARVGGWVLHCRHPDGSISILANEPGSGGKPILLLRYEESGPDWTV